MNSPALSVVYVGWGFALVFLAFFMGYSPFTPFVAAVECVCVCVLPRPRPPDDGAWCDLLAAPLLPQPWRRPCGHRLTLGLAGRRPRCRFLANEPMPRVDLVTEPSDRAATVVQWEGLRKGGIGLDFLVDLCGPIP